jgi:AcrR family transcriptional regulator
VETKDRILRAARRRFDHGGIDNISMRSLAQDVGVTAMALYRHYPDKDAIVHALTLDALEDWERRIERVAANEPLQWLHEHSEVFLDFALQAPRRFEAAFLLPSERIRSIPDVIEAGISPSLNKAMDAIRRGQCHGVICDGPPLELLMNLWGLYQGLISLYRAARFSGGEPAFRKIYRAAVRRCLRSIQKSEGCS